MNINQLKCLVSLSNHLNYTKAAEELGISQPGLTKQIQGLEKYLGGDLFIRSKRNVELSPIGREFLASAEVILKEHDDALANISNQSCIKQNKIIIASNDFFSQLDFDSMKTKFLDENPGVSIDTKEETYNTHELIMMLKSSKLNAILFTYEETRLNVDFAIRVFPLAYDDIVLLVPNKNPLSKRKRISLSEIEKFVENFNTNYEDTRKIEGNPRFMMGNNKIIDGGISLNSTVMLRGIDVTVCSRYLALMLQKTIQNTTIVELKPRQKRVIAIGVRDDYEKHPALVDFIDCAIDWASSRGESGV